MQTLPEIQSPHPHVILFDGVCNLCNGVVQHILKHDQRQIIYFASLQSDFGQSVLQQLSMPGDALHTVIFLNNGKAQFESEAFLGLAATLGGWHKIFLFGRILPQSVRNLIYRFIARNRYSIFGRTESCMVPDQKWLTRFID